MWSWSRINVWVTSTVGGVFVFALLFWFLQFSVSLFLSFLCRRIFPPSADVEKGSLIPKTKIGLGIAGHLCKIRAVFCSGFGSSVAQGQDLGNSPAPHSGTPASGQTDVDPGTHLTDTVIHGKDGSQLSNLTTGLKRRRTNNGKQRVIQTFRPKTDHLQGAVQEKWEDVDSHMKEAAGIVGLKIRVEDVKDKLQAVTSLGLYGMGGVGKSTMARALFEDLSLIGEFEYTCFVSDLKELVTKYSGRKLTSKILEGLRCGRQKETRKHEDWSTLKGKKVLLVLDDVDYEHQLQDIPSWKGGWFRTGSRLLVTARNKSLLNRVCEGVYEVETLGREHSRQLFIYHAFQGTAMPFFLRREGSPLTRILDVCEGVPLALEVVGKCLFKEMDKGIWMSVVEKLAAGQPVDGDSNNKLLNSLRLSFEACANEEQELFLDAALLYRGNLLVDTLAVWTACWGPTAKKSWQNLEHKCLVKENEIGRVFVHEQFHLLARGMSCSKHESTQSWLRIGLPLHFKQLLRTVSQEPAKTQSLVYLPRFSNPPLVLQGPTFSEAKFPNLRVLNMRGIDLQGEMVYLPSTLVVLSWSDAAYTQFPFDLTNLKNLKILELKGWKVLKVAPDGLEACTALTKLQLKGCQDLKALPTGIVNLTKLAFLGLEDSGLTELPDFLIKLKNLEILQLTKTKVSHLPDSIGDLKKLRELQLRNTPMPKFPGSVTDLHALISLDLSRTDLNVLPDAIGDLVGLKKLNLSCTKVKWLPNSIGLLNQLSTFLMGSTPLEELPESLGDMVELEVLYLSNTKLKALPDSISTLLNLRQLHLAGTPFHLLPESCRQARSLNNQQQLEYLCLSDTLGVFDTSVETLPDTSVETLPESFNQLFTCKGHLKDVPSGSCGGLTSPKYQISTTTSNLNYLASLTVNKHTIRPDLNAFTTSIGSPQLKHFSHLQDLKIIDQDSVHQFTERLLDVLHNMDSLQNLLLVDFDGVKSLPDDFGFLLPQSLQNLHFCRWQILEELPESIGQLTMLKGLDLEDCVSLRSLPGSLSKLPHLDRLGLVGCKTLKKFPTSFAASVLAMSTSFTVKVDTWNLLVNLVTYFGHISRLQIEFYIHSKTQFEELTGLKETTKFTKWMSGDWMLELMTSMKDVLGSDLRDAVDHIPELFCQLRVGLRSDFVFGERCQPPRACFLCMTLGEQLYDVGGYKFVNRESL